MKKRTELILTLLGLVIALLSFLFGDDLYQKIKGHSIFVQPSLTETPQDPIVQSTQTLSIVPFERNYTIFSDLESWYSGTDLPTVENTPYILSCLQKVRWANPEGKTAIFVDLISTIKMVQQQAIIASERQPTILKKDPLPAFSCIEVSVLSEMPRGSDQIHVIVELPDSQNPSPTATYGLDGEFILLPDSVSECSANKDAYFDRTYLRTQPIEKFPISSDQSIFDLYILTTFFSKPDGFQYLRNFQEGSAAVSIEQEFVDVYGNKIPLAEYNCFYVYAR